MDRLGAFQQTVNGYLGGAAHLVAVAAAFGGGLALAGCASVGGEQQYSYDQCPEGQERVRIGPRGQAPKYICRNEK